MDEPLTFTIPKGSEALPDGMGQMKVGQGVAVNATITAIDDNGMTLEVQDVEAAPQPNAETDEAPSGAEAETGAEAGAEGAGEENPQADYVRSRRKKMMAGTE